LQFVLVLVLALLFPADYPQRDGKLSI